MFLLLGVRGISGVFALKSYIRVGTFGLTVKYIKLKIHEDLEKHTRPMRMNDVFDFHSIYHRIRDCKIKHTRPTCKKHVSTFIF